MSTMPIVDLSTLEQISMGDEEMMRDIVETFLSETPSQIDAMSKAADCSDFKALKMNAHKVKSSVALMGCAPVVEVLRLLEYGDDADTEATTKNIRQLQQYSVQIISELNAYLQQ